jgi:hypothetical protein
VPVGGWLDSDPGGPPVEPPVGLGVGNGVSPIGRGMDGTGEGFGDATGDDGIGSDGTGSEGTGSDGIGNGIEGIGAGVGVGLGVGTGVGTEVGTGVAVGDGPVRVTVVVPDHATPSQTR